MMTKPPGFASSSTLPLEDDEEESIDESLDEILLEANEKPQENSVKSLEAVPSSLEESEIDDDSDVIDSAMADGTGRTASPPSEITVIAPRPTFADDEVKEETKVDPYETAMRAAASREVGLTSQASHQRERALRKNANTPVRVPTRAALAEVEFEEAETGDEDPYGSAPHGEHSERTPADIPIAEDSVPSPAGGYVTASGGFMPRLPPPGRPMPPPGRPDIYPGRRIPTPSSDFLPPPSGGGFGSGAHYPSIAIPAPAAHDGSTRSVATRIEARVRLRPAGLGMFLVTAFAGGLLVGALLWRGQAPSSPIDLPVVTHAVSKPVVPILAEPVQPIVKPVPPSTAAATAPAPTTTAPAGDHPGSGPAVVPTLAAETVPVVAESPPAPPVDKPKKRVKKITTLDEDLAAAAEETAPPPPRARKKKATAWQDPFAQ